MRYSIFSLAAQALGGHKGWTPAWRDAAPRDEYDVVIVGGGGGSSEYRSGSQMS